MFSTTEYVAGSGLVSLLLGPHPRSVVRVVYSDESGLGSEKEEPITIVAGLMLNMDSQWYPVVELIEAALADFIGKEKISTYEIRGRTLYYQIKKGDTKAAKLMAALIDIPSQCHVPIFYGAVDRTGSRYFKQTFSHYFGQDFIQSSENPFQEAFTECLHQVDTYVNVAFPKEQVLWVHDRGRYEDHAKKNLRTVRQFINTGSRKETEKVFNEVRDILRNIQQEVQATTNEQSGIDFLVETLQRMFGEGHCSVKSHLVDTVYFGNSEESRAIQLADIYCSTIVHHLRKDLMAYPYYALLRRQIIKSDIRPLFEDAQQLLPIALKFIEKNK